jgi:hypothetical protein
MRSRRSGDVASYPDHWADLTLWIAAPSGGPALPVTNRNEACSVHWLPLKHMTIVTACGV